MNMIENYVRKGSYYGYKWQVIRNIQLQRLCLCIVYSLSQDFYAALLDDFFIKNIHTCERSALDINERGNFQDIIFHILLCIVTTWIVLPGTKTDFLQRLIKGIVYIFSPVGSLNTLRIFSTLSSRFPAMQNSRIHRNFCQCVENW